MLLDLAAVEPDVLSILDQGGYRGLVRLQGIASPAIIRLLNDNGFDARGIRGAGGMNDSLEVEVLYPA